MAGLISQQMQNKLTAGSPQYGAGTSAGPAYGGMQGAQAMPQPQYGAQFMGGLIGGNQMMPPPVGGNQARPPQYSAGPAMAGQTNPQWGVGAPPPQLPQPTLGAQQSRAPEPDQRPRTPGAPGGVAIPGTATTETAMGAKRGTGRGRKLPGTLTTDLVSTQQQNKMTATPAASGPPAAQQQPAGDPQMTQLAQAMNPNPVAMQNSANFYQQQMAGMGPVPGATVTPWGPNAGRGAISAQGSTSPNYRPGAAVEQLNQHLASSPQAMQQYQDSMNAAMRARMTGQQYTPMANPDMNSNHLGLQARPTPYMPR